MERPPGAEEKPWGWAQEASRLTYPKDDGSLAVLCRTVWVFIAKGGYSSIHRHNQCHNIFSVTSGRLLLKRCGNEPPYEPFAHWIQEVGDRPFTFEARAPHQFLALTDVLGLEIYLAIHNGTAGPEDIERFSVNGSGAIIIEENKFDVQTRNYWGPEYGK